MNVTDEEFEKALEICNAYVSQLAKKLADVRGRMKEIHAANSEDSRFLTAGIALMTKDSPIESLRRADGRLYNVLRLIFPKDSPISVLETITEDEFVSLRNSGPAVLKRVKGLMNVTNLKFKDKLFGDDKN